MMAKKKGKKRAEKQPKVRHDGWVIMRRDDGCTKWYTRGYTRARIRTDTITAYCSAVGVAPYRRDRRAGKVRAVRMYVEVPDGKEEG